MSQQAELFTPGRRLTQLARQKSDEIALIVERQDEGADTLTRLQIAPQARGADYIRALQVGLDLYQLVKRAAANAQVSRRLGSPHTCDRCAFNSAVFDERVAHNLLERSGHML
jgi:hypothetical protein